MLTTGTGAPFIAVSVVALTEGGLSMLASLIVVSSLFQFALTAWLPLLRRIITPLVSGMSLMLIAVTVMPIAVGRVMEVPAGALPAAGISVAAVTLAAVTVLALRASGIWRLWSPLIGIAAGCAVAAVFGLYDVQRVIEAPWIDLPDIAAWPGLDLTPGAEFWALSADLRDCDSRGRRQDQRRRYRHSTDFAAPTAGDRFSHNPGRTQHQRAWAFCCAELQGRHPPSSIRRSA